MKREKEKAMIVSYGKKAKDMDEMIFV